MRLKTETVKRLIVESNLSQNQLARDMGIARGTLSNALSGQRGAGRKVIAGLLRVFSEERIEDLVYMEGRKEQHACNL